MDQSSIEPDERRLLAVVARIGARSALRNERNDAQLLDNAQQRNMPSRARVGAQLVISQ
ncbi:MAG TPA: hypothetical protein VFV87_15005 [Pirellulaceae bacterium]|nr:hypothetical protein [Pirellulaceae bacterium]